MLTSTWVVLVLNSRIGLSQVGVVGVAVVAVAVLLATLILTLKLSLSCDVCQVNVKACKVVMARLLRIAKSLGVGSSTKVS